MRLPVRPLSALVGLALAFVVTAQTVLASPVADESGDSAAIEILGPAPALVEPADGAHTTGNPDDPDTSRLRYSPLGIPSFAWEDLGAAKYELEVATTPAFGASVVLKLSSLQYSTYTPTGSDESGSGFGLTDDSLGNFIDEATFYWHVRAWDSTLKQWGAFSPTRSFIRHWGYAPTLQYPETLTTHGFTPHFSWAPVPGASFYQIQVDTSSSFGSPYISAATDVPFYASLDSLPNDDDLFWRVRAFHRPNTSSFTGGRGGPWSEVRQFKLAWASRTGSGDTRPLLLTPPNNANNVYRPLFCWQPVPGAKKYYIDVSTSPGFVANSFAIKEASTEGTCYAFNRNSTYKLEPNTVYYWRVWAADDKGRLGQRTDEGSGPFQFRTVPAEPPLVPALFYPFYYYPPLAAANFEDRTVAVPTFVWDHVDGATSYQLLIDDDPAMAPPHVAEITTDNAGYTFTDLSTYPLENGRVYYWKVRSDVSPTWSEMSTRWLARVDTALLQPATSLNLIRPTYQTQPWTGGYRYGEESVTYYPVFAWTATAATGQVAYEIQIARDSGFGDVVQAQVTDFTEYTPTGRPDPGTYFWRVRVKEPSEGAWTLPGRFIVARNFTFVLPAGEWDPMGDAGEWAAAVPAYAPAGEAADVAGDANLSALYIANDSANWRLGIPLANTAKLGLYLDTDHFDESGAAGPPAGKPDPGAPVAHRPEYALYWDAGTWQVWRWGGSAWQLLGPLTSISSSFTYYPGTSFLELNLSTAAIGQPGSLSLMLFTYDDGGQVQDRLPNVPGQPAQPAFLTESTTPTPLFPANAPNDAGLATLERNTPVLIWRHNDVFDSSTFFFETYQDDTASNLYESENGNCPFISLTNNTFFDAYTYWAPQVHYSDNNSYNWRVKRAGFGPAALQRFGKAGYIPSDLMYAPMLTSADGSATYTDRTPSFCWEPAQSAVRYRWELYEGGQRRDYKDVMLPCYAPRDAIKDGTYTWKVWGIDARGRLTQEAAQGAFTKVSQVVTGLQVYYDENWLRLRWNPVDNAAYYAVLIASDDQFSRDLKSYTTHNSTFTPETVPAATKTGSFYVRIITRDNKNNAGPHVDLYFVGPRAYLPVVPKTQ